MDNSGVVDVTKELMDLQENIADRYIAIGGNLNIKPPEKDELQMSLFFCERCSHNPRVDWERLLKADDFNFVHDVTGIHNSASREETFFDDGTIATPGYLGNFCPRFTK